MPRVSFYTLGCRLNQADTGHVADDLQRHGYELVPWGEASELLVVNSCAVTGTASQKTRQVLRQARRRFPDAFLVLMGCDATVDLTTWSAGPAVPGWSRSASAPTSCGTWTARSEVKWITLPSWA